MLFAVRKPAMNGTGAVLRALDAIVERVEDDVHELEITHADELEASTWYQSSRPDRQTFLEKSATASLHRTPRTQGPHLRRVEVDDAAAAERARQLARVTLLVLLEDDVSDGALVEAALRKLARPETIKLCFGAPSRLVPPAFAMESRGGNGQLKKLIPRRVKEAESRGHPPRLVVVADSDGEWPGDVKEDARDIRKLCFEHGIPCPPLNKRTAENYIPDAVWRAWAAELQHTAAQPAVQALLGLSAAQRDHVHMAPSGTIPWDENKPDAADLFQNVSPSDRDLLNKADLKGKRDKMMILELKNRPSAFTEADLRQRDHGGDLVELVRRIEDEL